MSILSWILFGLIAGAIAKALHPGKDPGGWIVTILIGIAGAFVGGWINSLLTDTPITSNWSLRGFLFAVGGAVILLWIYAMATRRRS
ncbi:GlsB/YeaQ/YmgE family stress response membrane protein [Niabella insulamsoli]|uniref:GlsB/YeaQ/YmgE family stress response membrane protein n=1 Tax=Niabella insulamsoli TaxID=3144874 RepID=UPI0031FC1DBE